MEYGLACAHLRRQEQLAYGRMLELLNRGITSFDARELNVPEPLTVLQALAADHPELIWFAPSAVRQTLGLFGSRVSLVGVITGPRRMAMEQELETATLRALEEIEAQGAVTDYDRLLCAYEYIQKTVTYDEGEKNRLLRTGQGEFLSHNAYGALVRKQAVCDGIAAGLCLLLRRLGITACSLSGRAAQTGEERLGHTWALVRLEGECFHLDPTWDLNKRDALGVVSYDYFCLDDITISMDHDWDSTRAPRCRSLKLSWFHRNRLYANNLTQTEEILNRLACTKATVLRLRLAEGVALPENEEEALGELLRKAWAAAGKSVSMRYGWNREMRTLTCRIT